MTYLNHEDHEEPKDINKLYQKRKFSNLHQPTDG